MVIRRDEGRDRRRGMQPPAATGEAYAELGLKPWVARVQEELEASR